MPGSRTSRPNCAEPSTLPGVSVRFARVPIRVNRSGALSATSFGTGSFDCGLRHFAVGQRIAIRIEHLAALDAALGNVDLPVLRGGLDQHHARRRARLAQALPGIAHAGAAAGDLHADHRVDIRGAGRRRFDRDGRERHLEFLREQHRQRGVDALPHLGTVHQHGDAVVAADLEPGIGHAARRRARRLFPAAARQRNRQHQAAAGQRGHLQEIPAARVGRHEGHDPPPSRASSAARWIALRMRG